MMQFTTDHFHQYACYAIETLTEKGYLQNPLDWDVKGQKYTLRIRGADRNPMVAVGLITFSNKDGLIRLVDAVTGNESIYKPSEPGSEDRKAFLDCIIGFVRQLRKESAYIKQ